MFTVYPTHSTLYPGEKAQSINITFRAYKEVVIKDQPILKCQVSPGIASRGPMLSGCGTYGSQGPMLSGCGTYGSQAPCSLGVGGDIWKPGPMLSGCGTYGSQAPCSLGVGHMEARPHALWVWDIWKPGPMLSGCGTYGSQAPCSLGVGTYGSQAPCCLGVGHMEARPHALWVWEGDVRKPGPMLSGCGRGT